MTTHPCDGHPCDHCYLCDVVGICCATVPNHAAVDGCCPDTAAQLRDALQDEATTTVSLTQLIRVEATLRVSTAPSAPELPAADPPAADLLLILETEARDVSSA